MTELTVEEAINIEQAKQAQYEELKRKAEAGIVDEVKYDEFVFTDDSTIVKVEPDGEKTVVVSKVMLEEHDYG